MKKKLLTGALAACMVAVLLALAAPALAGSGITRRGDYQVLKNDESGATIRVWVQNTSCYNGHALVTFVGKDLEGNPVQASYTVWVPARSYRPVNISFGFPISTDPKIIVTSLGGGAGSTT